MTRTRELDSLLRIRLLHEGRVEKGHSGELLVRSSSR